MANSLGQEIVKTILMPGYFSQLAATGSKLRDDHENRVEQVVLDFLFSKDRIVYQHGYPKTSRKVEEYRERSIEQFGAGYRLRSLMERIESRSSCLSLLNWMGECCFIHFSSGDLDDGVSLGRLHLEYFIEINNMMGGELASDLSRFFASCFCCHEKEKKESRGVVVEAVSALFPGVALIELKGGGFLDIHGSWGNLLCDLGATACGMVALFNIFTGNVASGFVCAGAGAMLYIDSRKTDGMLMVIDSVEKSKEEILLEGKKTKEEIIVKSQESIETNTQKILDLIRQLYGALYVQIREQFQNGSEENRTALTSLEEANELFNRCPALLEGFLAAFLKIKNDAESLLGEKIRMISGASERLGGIIGRTEEAAKNLERLTLVLQQFDQKISALTCTDTELKSSVLALNFLLEEGRRYVDDIKKRSSIGIAVNRCAFEAQAL